MNIEKKLGICMDHASAILIEFPINDAEAHVVITSESNHDVEHNNRSENITNHKEQHQHAEYYKKIGTVMRGYGEVLLFGPTTAKAELVNTLKGNHLFENIQIDVKQTDKLTGNQQLAFVKDHFSKILTA